MIRIAIGVLLLAMALPVAANQLAINRGGFDTQREAIEQALSDGTKYGAISTDDRADVRSALSRMSAMITRAGSVDQLSAEEKTAVFNEQERVNTILTKASADSRVVCDHTAKVGTRMKTTKCETVAERRRRRDADINELQMSQRLILPVSN